MSGVNTVAASMPSSCVSTHPALRARILQLAHDHPSQHAREWPVFVSKHTGSACVSAVEELGKSLQSWGNAVLDLKSSSIQYTAQDERWHFRKSKKITSFAQPTRLVTCANHGSSIMVAMWCADMTKVGMP